MNSKKIEVWYDETSDPSEPMWCVSLCQDDGDEINCLSTHEEREDAIVAGKKSAEKRGLKIFERGEHGELSEIE